MQRKSWADANCPMARSVDLIGEWGSLLILREAFGGVRRFDEFQKRIGLSRNLLTTRLNKLVDGGILERRAATIDGKRQEYCLTAMGEDLLATIVSLRQWGDRWLFPGGNYPADMIDARDNSAVERMEVRSKKGRKLTLANLSLKAHRQTRNKSASSRKA